MKKYILLALLLALHVRASDIPAPSLPLGTPTGNTNTLIGIDSQNKTKLFPISSVLQTINQVTTGSNVTYNTYSLYDTNTLTMTGSGTAGANAVYTIKLPTVGGKRVWTNSAGTYGIVEYDPNGAGANLTITNGAGTVLDGYTAQTISPDFISNLPIKCSPNPTYWFGYDGVDYSIADGTTCASANIIGSTNVTTSTNISLSNPSINNDIISLVGNTHLGPTISWASKGAQYPLLYVTNGEGIVRSLEFTSKDADVLDQRTNYYLRVYCDAGAVDLSSSGANLPSAYLTANIPFASLMCCKYWPYFRSNYVGALTFGTRYVGWTEVSSNASAFGIGHYTMTFRYPMPFTNGVVMVLWDNNANTPVDLGFSYVGYETNTVPNYIRDFRLKSYHNVFTNGLNTATNATILNYTNAGTICSIFVSALSPTNNAFWEGIWYQETDYGARYQFGCAGGEDLFNNGYYMDSGATSTWDWGTRYIHSKQGTDNYVVEAYRHFSPADTETWAFRQYLYFVIPSGYSNIVWDSTALFYGKN